MAPSRLALKTALLLCISSMCDARLINDIVSSDFRADDAQQPAQAEFHWALYLLLSAGLMLAVVAALMASSLLIVCFVRTLGFTAAGITAGSRAALIMGLYEGRVTVGSFCAVCQRIGALGLVSLSTLCSLCPLIAAATVVLLITFGIIEFLQLDIGHSIGSLISESRNTIDVAEMWNAIRLHVT